jgi:hypothetical protein
MQTILSVILHILTVKFNNNMSERCNRHKLWNQNKFFYSSLWRFLLISILNSMTEEFISSLHKVLQQQLLDLSSLATNVIADMNINRIRIRSPRLPSLSIRVQEKKSRESTLLTIEIGCKNMFWWYFSRLRLIFTDFSRVKAFIHNILEED